MHPCIVAQAGQGRICIGRAERAHDLLNSVGIEMAGWAVVEGLYGNVNASTLFRNFDAKRLRAFDGQAAEGFTAGDA